MPEEHLKSNASEYERSVFINCPLDPLYQALFRGIVFAIEARGYVTRCALEVEDSAEVVGRTEYI